MNADRGRHVITPLPAAEPLVGRWLGVLDDTRRRTKEDLEGLDPRALDWPVEGGNAIGTLLAHIAAIEMDYLYVDILEQDIPAEVLAILPLDVRDEQGNLWVVAGESLGQHWQRLDATRAIFNDKLSALTLDDFYRVRELPPYDVTPEWVMHHLAQHEAGHLTDINTVRAAFARSHQDES